MAILDKKAESEGVALPQDVRIFIATKTKSNVRELEGALTRLIAVSSMTGQPISIGHGAAGAKTSERFGRPPNFGGIDSPLRSGALLPNAGATQDEKQYTADRVPAANRHVSG